MGEFACSFCQTGDSSPSMGIDSKDQRGDAAVL